VNIDIDARDNHPLVAIMALPNERVSFLFFKQMEHQYTQYSIIPLFHHSNCERSELTCMETTKIHLEVFHEGEH
jgi:hypothetical protein